MTKKYLNFKFSEFTTNKNFNFNEVCFAYIYWSNTNISNLTLKNP